MKEPYVTIAGKRVFPKPPSAAQSHVIEREGETAWEEGWQRETTRISIPIGTVVLIGLLAFILWRILRRR